jgi:hypothetical protein
VRLDRLIRILQGPPTLQSHPREFDLERARSVGHSHAADLDERGATEQLGTEALRPKLVEAVRQALGAMEPVTIGLGAGACPIGANRRELRVNKDGTTAIVLGRNPYGPTDKEVLVMKVAKADGKLAAVAFDYATHATCLGPRNFAISGDVLGLTEQFAEKVLGSDVVARFCGASQY